MLGETRYYSPPLEEDKLAKLPIMKFIRIIEQKHNVKLDSYSALHDWSCNHFDDFWEDVLIFSGFILRKGYAKVVEDVPFTSVPKWFVGSELNYAENLLFAHGRGYTDKVAVIEARSPTEFTSYGYNELRNDVVRLAVSLKEIGVGVGDRVVGYLTNSYQTTVAVLAATAVGAVWSSASVDFGTRGVLERFLQLDPVVLFAAANARYKGKAFCLEQKVSEIAEGLPTLKKVILVNPLRKDISDTISSGRGRFVKFEDLLCLSTELGNFEFASVPFNHPLFIMFSSGTTGPPKGMVHTVGGTLLKHVEEHILQTGFTIDDSIFFYTTCGWMMWNWLISCLFIGMTIVLYDESPLEPDRHVLLKIAARHKCTALGMGAKIYDEYRKVGGCPADLYDLSCLKTVLSTGSPLSDACFKFINEKISRNAVIGSISGGTDIIGCFMGACQILPVVEGECQCSYLGMDIASYNEEGNAVKGIQGELVCRRPFPSMPSHFIDDADGHKYRHAYFERFPHVWTHGDYCYINPKTNGIVMLGRSDATLNRGGVRIGTAEIYAIVETFNEIADSIVASQKFNKNGDEKIVLFVKMAADQKLTDLLKSQLRQKLRSQMSPRHVPDDIREVADIPYTISGKKVELAVKQTLNGEEVKELSSLRNPNSLVYFRPVEECF